MDIKEAYKQRRKIEEEGVWCAMFGNSDAEIKIKATSRNKEFARLIKGVINGQRISDDILFDKLVKACAESVVLDWKGFESDFSKDAFIEMCNELKECGFLEDVLAFAMDAEMFNQVAIAQTEKNL